MTKTLIVAVFATLALSAFGPRNAEAQTAPTTRIVTSTSFNVPFQDRAKFFAFANEYFIPAVQLHPKVLNFRLLNHNWGSDGSQIIMVAEYASFNDIEADCGKPCDDYFAAHEAPEEGDAGYAEYQENLAVFNKYYSTHSDEIYATNMNRAVVEGRRATLVGPNPPPSN